MRYDSATHAARAALLAEGAAQCSSPRLRVKLLAHAVIAQGLARLAEEDATGCLCMFIGARDRGLDDVPRPPQRH